MLTVCWDGTVQGRNEDWQASRHGHDMMDMVDMMDALSARFPIPAGCLESADTTPVAPAIFGAFGPPYGSCTSQQR
jgi:hypothetical protein